MKAFRTQTEGAEPSVHAHYLYDAAGQRVKKLVRKQGGQIDVTHYIDGAFEHHRWGGQAQAGENNHVHVMDDRQRVALVRLGVAHPDDRGPAVQFHLADHLGSSNAVVDASGTLTNREEFTPYGETSFGSFARKRYRFTGKERDEESGLNYHTARYYLPWLGRWTSADPVGLGDGVNVFAYAKNNPVSGIDTSGKDTKDVVTSDNFLTLSQEHMKNMKLPEQQLDRDAPLWKSSERNNEPFLQNPRNPFEDSFERYKELFGRITVKLKDFNPPGWRPGDVDACFELALEGANTTAKAGETARGGGGVFLYEAKTIGRMKTDKTASDVALTQIRRHIDSGRALLAGVNEPLNPTVINADKQPVTDHFLDIYGYETDIHGKITSLYAKDNAVGPTTAEVRFFVNPNGSITKPVETGRGYFDQEYQLSEVRFHTSLPYTDYPVLTPTNDAREIMYWPVLDLRGLR